MSRTFRRGERHIRARGIRQDHPDLRRIIRALAEAEAEAEAEADAEAQARRRTGNPAPAAKPRRSNRDRKDAA